MATTSYDHEIVAGTATTKLKLMRTNRTQQNPDGEVMYSVAEVIPEHQELLEFSQKDWTGGHGQYHFENPSMYFDGQSIDTTQEGRVILGPKINEVYQTNVLKEYYNTGDDLYQNVTNVNWYGQTFTPSDNHTILNIKVKVTRFAMPGTVTVSLRATAAGVPTGSDLAVGTFDGNALQNEGTGEWPVVTLTPSYAVSSGTMYAIVVRSTSSTLRWFCDSTAPAYAGGTIVSSSDSGASWTSAAAVDCMFETWTTATTELDSTPNAFIWGASMGKLLVACAASTYVYTSGAWAVSGTTLASISQMAEYDAIVYGARGAGSTYAFTTDGSLWTVTDLTDTKAWTFLSAPNAGGTQNVLWKASSTNQLKYTTDGRLAGTTGVQWSSAAYIGDTSNEITNLFTSSDELMIGRTDNLYSYDNNGGIHALKDDLRNNRSTNNFKYICHYQGATYASVGTGIAEIVGGSNGTYELVGPLTLTGDIDKVGIPVGLTSDSDYLYVAMLEETVTHIYKGKKVNGQWSWCPWVYLGTNNCTTIYVAQHSSTDRRLWFGYGTHTGYVQITDNPTTDANARFAASGFVRLSWLYGTNPYYDKMFQSVVTETAACAASITVTPKYRLDANTAMTNLTAAAISTNGVQRTMAGTALSCKRIQFELDLATNDATITPQVLMFILRGHEKPETYRVHEAVYEAENKETRRSSTVRSALRAARASSSLVKFADLRWKETTAGTAGTDYQYVVMEPGYPQETPVTTNKTQPPEIGLKVRWREVNYT